MIKENFIDCEKRAFLIAEKIIGLTILKANSSAETIKTCILSLEQKFSLLSFSGVDRINTILSRINIIRIANYTFNA